MSIVIYGPSGCGKTRNGERLRRFFGMTRVIDGDELQSREGLYADLCHTRRAADIRNKRAVILTCEYPPPEATLNVRTMSFDEAMREMARNGA